MLPVIHKLRIGSISVATVTVPSGTVLRLTKVDSKTRAKLSQYYRMSLLLLLNTNSGIGIYTTEMQLLGHRERGVILKTKPHAQKLYNRRQQGYWTQSRPGQDADSELEHPTKTAKNLDQIYSGVPEQLLGEKSRRGHDRHEPGIFIHQSLHAAGQFRTPNQPVLILRA
jgi:hypothetical protein